jgi:hypothetical protein
MYKNQKRRLDTNGYIIVHCPEHPKAMKNGSFEGYVYEHVLMAEEILDRSVKEGEVVHHLDENKSNNSPDNLLILSNPMHVKLHGWLNKHEIKPKEKQEERIRLGCIRCKTCEKPILPNLIYCSPQCTFFDKRKYDHPNKETLTQMVWSEPTSKVAMKLGVSDKAIEKLCKKFEVEKPPRGYWMKNKSKV